MLKWAKEHPRVTTALLVAVAATLLFLISLLIPVIGHLCTYDEYGNPKECGQHHLGPFALFWIVQLADEHNGLVTAVATVLLMGITYMLVQLGREQSKTTRAQLRAYVMIDTVAKTGVEPDTVPAGRVKIKNFGQTPAHNVRAVIGMGFARFPFKDMQWHSKTAVPEAQFGRSLGPNDNFSLSIDLARTITAPQIVAMEEGRWALWINGKIFYRDVFDTEHETEFGLFTTKDTGIGMWGAIDTLNRSD